MSKEDFHREIVKRLRASGVTRAQMALALAVLQQIRWYSVGPDLDVCAKTGAEIGEELGIKSNDMPEILGLLETVGAISRIADGREKVICLSPNYSAAEKDLGKFREITLPLFPTDGKLGFKVGGTNLRGLLRQIRDSLSEYFQK